MAEKRFIKGLFKDTSHIDQIEGSWRYARNMVVNETDGAISNEGGTDLAGHLGTSLIVGALKDSVVGKIEVNNDRVILFVVDSVTTVNPRSEIGNSGPVPHIYLHDIYKVTYAYQKSINTGGGLLTGVYYLALAYVDDDLISTNYLTVSNPVSIVDEYYHSKPTHKKD